MNKFEQSIGMQPEWLFGGNIEETPQEWDLAESWTHYTTQSNMFWIGHFSIVYVDCALSIWPAHCQD